MGRGCLPSRIPLPLRTWSNDCRDLCCRVNSKPHWDNDTKGIYTRLFVPCRLCYALLRHSWQMYSPRRTAATDDGSRCERLQMARAEENQKMSPMSFVCPLYHPMFPMSPTSSGSSMSTTSVPLWSWFFSGVAQPGWPQPQPA